jgi:hypothetical protein
MPYVIWRMFLLSPSRLVCIGLYIIGCLFAKLSCDLILYPFINIGYTKPNFHIHYSHQVIFHYLRYLPTNIWFFNICYEWDNFILHIHRDDHKFYLFSCLKIFEHFNWQLPICQNLHVELLPFIHQQYLQLG